MTDRPPPLRLLPSDEGGGDDATPPPASPGKKTLPRNLYLPAPTMKTLWCRFSIDGVVYRRSTGCRDVWNGERRAAAIRVELEAEARGIAGPKRVLLQDAVRDFGRHIATGRGGVDRQEKNIRLLLTVLGPKPVRFVDELSLDIYDAFVARGEKPTKRCAEGFTQATIHCYAQVIRRFGKWLEDTDRLVHHALPRSLEYLLQKEARTGEPYLERIPRDPWRHPYTYRILDEGRGQFEVRSDGEDGIVETDDDLVKTTETVPTAAGGSPHDLPKPK